MGVSTGKHLLLIALLLALLLAACGKTDFARSPVVDDGGATASDLDSDTDVDVDSDTGADTESCFEGDYAINDGDDMEALVPYPCLVGHLVVETSELTSLDLPNLAWVTGWLGIRDNDVLANVEMGALNSVGGSLQIGNGTGLLCSPDALLCSPDA